MAHACSISWCGTGGYRQGAGWHRQPNCARWPSLRGRATACCRACQSPITICRATRRKWPSRQRTALEHRRFGWRPSTGAHHLARSLEAEIRCPSAPDGELVFRSLDGEQRARPDQEGRNGTGTNHDHVDPGQVRRVARWRVGDRIHTRGWHDRTCPSTAALPGGSVHGAAIRPGLPTGESSMQAYPGLGKTTRDSRAGRPIVAGSARRWNRRCTGVVGLAGRLDDRAWFDLARPRPVNVCLHQDRPAAQSLSYPSALAGSVNFPMVTCWVAALATQHTGDAQSLGARSTRMVPTKQFLFTGAPSQLGIVGFARYL